MQQREQEPVFESLLALGWPSIPKDMLIKLPRSARWPYFRLIAPPRVDNSIDDLDPRLGGAWGGHKRRVEGVSRVSARFACQSEANTQPLSLVKKRPRTCEQLLISS